MEKYQKKVMNQSSEKSNEPILRKRYRPSSKTGGPTKGRYVKEKYLLHVL